MSSEDSRKNICEAAMRLAAREGLTSVTIERVATEAGLSKGGVLHHFPSKDKLLIAVVQYFGHTIETQLNTAVAADDDPRMKWVRNMLAICFPSPHEANTAAIPVDTANKFFMALLAASLHDKNLIAPIRAIGTQIKERLVSYPHDGFEQILLWLALDGLFLWEMVGMIDPQDRLHGELVAAMRERAFAPANREITVSKP